MSDRFFLWEPPAGDRCLLSEEESHHFLRVMKRRPGDELILFDGTGWEARARATRVEKGRVEAEMIDRREVSREPPLALDIAVAIPKGRRMEQMLRALAELGAREVFPILSVRGSVVPRPGAAARWHRVAVEAAKQCRRNVLLEVAEPTGISDLLSTMGEYALRILPHTDSAETLGDVIPQGTVPSPAIALIGPEGGFSPAEVGAAVAAGFLPVRLAPSTLRLETAACAVAAALLIR